MEITVSISPKVTWIFVFMMVYWGYCIFWGIRGALSARTASDYFVAARQLPFWVFIFAVTATTYSGWVFLGDPGLVYVNGLQHAHTFLYAITMSFTGILFWKRQWLLGKHYDFMTPGEMLAYYFKSDLFRLLVILVALVFSIPYVGLQLRASGFLFNVLTDGLLGEEFGMWVLSTMVVIYVASGGLRAVAQVDVLQGILLAAGIVIIGLITLYFVGGWERLLAGVTVLSQEDTLRTPDGYSHYVAIPGVIQFVSQAPQIEGGAWTGTLLLTYMLGIMGIFSAPAFSMWAFASKHPGAFAPQQVWASAFFMGIVVIFFTTVQGLGGHFLGADQALRESHPELVNPVMMEGLRGTDLMATPDKQDILVPQLINLIGDSMPWLVGLLAVCALAAMQSTSAAYMATTGSMLTRDLFRRFIMPNADDNLQKFVGRLSTMGIVMLALLVATTAMDALAFIGVLAISYGLQMWPALIAICYWPYLTRQGVALGLLAGLIVVTLTEGPQWFGITAWGRWPWTIHSAGWGIICNFSVAVLVSLVTKDDLEHKLEVHNLLHHHASLPPAKRRWVPLAWILTVLWFIFAIGPGAVLGNTLFGDPNNPPSWWLGMPSIWIWQILWWALGVALLWFLAYYLEMATGPEPVRLSAAEDIARTDQNQPDH